MSESILRIDYVDRQRPCWICGLSLAKSVRGEHRGKWVAAIRLIDGLERQTHRRCQDDEWYYTEEGVELHAEYKRGVSEDYKHRHVAARRMR
jgi:hypothetical protein